jgi:hypothetical protein
MSAFKYLTGKHEFDIFNEEIDEQITIFKIFEENFVKRKLLRNIETELPWDPLNYCSNGCLKSGTMSCEMSFKIASCWS